MAARAQALSKMSQQDLLNLLGTPNMLWIDLWEDPHIRQAYEDLRNFDDRLQRDAQGNRVSAVTGRVWKTASFLAARLSKEAENSTPPYRFYEERRQEVWSRVDALIYAVKEVIEKCYHFPIMSSADMNPEQVRAALAILMKVASTCNGRTMAEVKPRSKRPALGPAPRSENEDWFDFLSRRTYNWLGDFIEEDLVLDPEDEAFPIHEALLQSGRPDEPDDSVEPTDSGFGSEFYNETETDEGDDMST